MTNPTTNPSAPAVRPSRLWRRPFLIGVAGIGLVVLTVAGIFYYRWHVAEQALQDAIAEADRLDPGWRLGELEARRALVPDDKNSAVHINKAGSTGFAIRNAGSTGGAELKAVYEHLDKIPPHVRVTVEQAELLRAALKPLAAPLADAHKVAELPTGRHHVDMSKPLEINLPHVDRGRFIVRLLSYDGMQHLHAGDFDSAWVCCRASLNIARSFGDEPIDVTQSVRAGENRNAIRQVERTLAHGQVKDKALAEMQKLLYEEFKHPALLIAVRGERAMIHEIFSHVEAGKISAAELRQLGAQTWGVPPGVKEEVAGYLSRHEFKPAHAWLLRYLTEAVEIVKLSGDSPEVPLRELEATLAHAPLLARQLAPKFERFATLKASRALCGCAIAALAAERYRLQHKHWPAALADLVAANLLDEVPTDPYDGKPLRLRATKSGIVIYSVGPNGDYGGTALDGNVPTADNDRLEFRLWHAERR
ncbi:MAG: hypothetical protein EXR98_05160 [Gemmataceae bacterium]|nr:hypothetical protein [Gemmataceae bacterium]